MNKEKTQEKLAKIDALLKELNVTYSVEEMITKEGFIRKIVYFLDNEKYEASETVAPEATPEPVSETTEA